MKESAVDVLEKSIKNANWGIFEKISSTSDEAVLRSWIRKFPKELALIAAIARNPHTPEDLIVELARHWKSEVRRSAAMNPSCPRKRLRILAEDKNPNVRSEVAFNRSTPRKIRKMLRKDKCHFVQLAAKRK